MEVLKIKRRTWYRGHLAYSFLRRVEDNKMCCLGFYCKHVGYKKKEILGVSVPEELADKHSNRLKGLLHADGSHTYITENLLTINDFEIDKNTKNTVLLSRKNGNTYSVEINSEADRERLIQKQFKLLKINVEFTN